MKRIITIILILLMFIPIYINASSPTTYSVGESQAMEYINKGNYRNSRERYIEKTSGSHFLDKTDYEISFSSNGKSYLFDGVEYWLSTSIPNKYFAVNYKGTVQDTSENNNYNVKDVEIIKSNVTVKGRGTYNNPWTFENMYEVKFIVDERYGYIIDGDTREYIKSVFVSNGGETSIDVSAKEGFSYITNDCGASFLYGKVTVTNVRRNLVCKLIIGTGRFKVTLNGATPNIVYSHFKDNFYKEEACKNVISSITHGNKTGYNFAGYKLNNGTIVVKSDGTFNKVATEKIMEVTVLDPAWDPKTYTVSFDPNGGTGGQSATVTATYEKSMPTISTTAPTRSGYTFMGWYDNKVYTSGTQYYTAVGASARNYNKDSDITLYAGWKDSTPPTCSITITTSNATLTYSDNSGSVVDYDLTKSSTPTYNKNTTLAVGTGTYYGYVKDGTGNIGSCNKIVHSTVVNTYTRKYQNCTRTGTSYSCPSGGTRSGSTCTITQSATNACSGACYYGTMSACSSDCSGQCSTSVDPNVPAGRKYRCYTKYTCPSGYTLSGSNCRRSYTATSTPIYGWGSEQTDYPTSCSTNSPSCNSTSVTRTNSCSVYTYKCESGYTSVVSSPTSGSYCYK